MGSALNKVIFVNRYYAPDLSATSQMLTDLSAALVRKGYEVAVVTSRQTYEDAKADLANRDVVAGVHVYRVDGFRFGRASLLGRALDYLSFYVLSFIKLLSITCRGDVIVAKTDPPLISVVAYVAAKLRGAKLVNWLQDVFPEVAVALGVISSKLISGPVTRLRNLSLRGAEANVVLSERMMAHVMAQGVDIGSIVTIPNWADGSRILPVPASENSLRREWGLENKFVVGYSGNMGRAHEFDTLIRGIKRLRSLDNICFLFIGGGAGKALIERQVEEARLDSCLFKPYQPRDSLSKSLSVPDIHIVSLQPSLEGMIFPSKIYGIMAAARPVIFIGDSNGDVAKLVGSINCGLSIAVGDDSGLAEAIVKMYGERPIAYTLGVNGRKVFEEQYDIDCSVGSWDRLLSDLI